MAAILEETVLKPTRADGTRWVDHRKRALVAFNTNFPTVVAHLHEISSMERQDIRREDSQKAKNWLKKICSFRFHAHLSLYLDIVNELSKLSLLFQSDSLSIPDVVDGVSTSLEILQELSTADGPQLGKFRRQVEAMEPNDDSYRGVTIHGIPESQESFDSFREEIVSKVMATLNTRFESFKSNKVFAAISALNPKSWPKDLKGHCDEEVGILLDHFNTILLKNGCQADEARAEWPRLRITIKKYYLGLTWNELWSRIFHERADEFKNILHLIELIQVIPLATAKVERAFSLMGRVKSDWRVNLDTSTLDDLMMISLEGPDESAFKPTAAVTKWWKAGKQQRRPHVLPYGQRKARSNEAATVVDVDKEQEKRSGDVEKEAAVDDEIDDDIQELEQEGGAEEQMDVAEEEEDEIESVSSEDEELDLMSDSDD